jgi:hypothetical protein
VATVSGGRTVWSVLSPCDTPRGAEGFSPRPAGSAPAQAAEAAAEAWRSVVPALAATPHARTSRDGGRTYPATHARPLPSGPPNLPATVPVYDAGSGTGRLLAIDLDPGRGLSSSAVTNTPPAGGNVTGGCDTQAAGLGLLLGRVGARHAADVGVEQQRNGQWR